MYNACRKLRRISSAKPRAKSREPTFPQALHQMKICEVGMVRFDSMYRSKG